MHFRFFIFLCVCLGSFGLKHLQDEEKDTKWLKDLCLATFHHAPTFCFLSVAHFSAVEEKADAELWDKNVTVKWELHVCHTAKQTRVVRPPLWAQSICKPPLI